MLSCMIKTDRMDLLLLCHKHHRHILSKSIIITTSTSFIFKDVSVINISHVRSD